MVHSLCPNIFGYDIVKAGLLLALFGGTKSETFRAESHFLMVGDPGLGKSQMLQACSNVTPRGEITIFVSLAFVLSITFKVFIYAEIQALVLV